METAASDVLTFLAPDHWTLKEAEQKRDGKLNKARLAHGKDQEDKIKEAQATFEKSKKHCRPHEGQISIFNCLANLFKLLLKVPVDLQALSSDNS